MPQQAQGLTLGQYVLGDYLMPPERELEKQPDIKLLQKQIQSVDSTLDLDIESIAKEKACAELFKQYFKQIDLSFLGKKHPACNYEGTVYTWLGEPGKFGFSLPAFAVYSLDSPACELEVRLSFDRKKISMTRVAVKSPQSLPSSVLDCLKSAISPYMVSGSVCGNRDFKITSIFTGAVPSEKIIKSGKRLFGERIYIISEVNNWTAEKIPIEDPLLVGVVNNNCFLLHQFNCTPLENQLLIFGDLT